MWYDTSDFRDLSFLRETMCNIRSLTIGDLRYLEHRVLGRIVEPFGGEKRIQSVVTKQETWRVCTCIRVSTFTWADLSTTCRRRDDDVTWYNSVTQRHSAIDTHVRVSWEKSTLDRKLLCKKQRGTFVLSTAPKFFLRSAI